MQRAEELVRERRDRLQETVGLHAADEERREDDATHDAGDRLPLHPPALGRGPEDRHRRAQLRDEDAQRRDDERGAHPRGIRIRDQLDEEVSRERDERRCSDHGEPPDDEGERRERRGRRARPVGAGAEAGTSEASSAAWVWNGIAASLSAKATTRITTSSTNVDGG